MARIRSIHPGQWTDEDFVELSPLARLLTLGLRNMADDQGVFDWKPKTIKMAIFPADSCDVSALLDELVTHNQVVRFEVDGKGYGAIRNFRKWQSPKYPNHLYPLPDELRSYVGLSSNTEALNSSHSPNGGVLKSPDSSNEGVLNSSDSSNEGVLNSSDSSNGDPSSTSSFGRPSEIAGQRERRGEERRGEERRGEERRGEDSTSAIADVSPPCGGDHPRLDLEPPTPIPRKPAPVPLQRAVEIWNALCGSAYGTVTKLTPVRERHLRSLLVEWPPSERIDRWEAYCRRLLASDFLSGRAPRSGDHANWRCNFDFSVRPATVVKVLEGRYDNRPRDGPPDAPRPIAPGTV